MTFRLYDAQTGGTLIGTVPAQQVTVIDSLFTFALPFPGSVWDGNDRWLDV